MASAFSKDIDRRSALATLGFAGLSLLRMPAYAMDADELRNDQLAKLLPNFSAQSRLLLSRLVSNKEFSGWISASDAAALAAHENKSIDQTMVALLPWARSYAHPPISNYFVGAVARGSSGALYLGANIEFPGRPLGFAVHGEQFALSNAYMHSETGIAAIAVTAAPCGHCRQFMTEMAPDGDIQVLIADKPAMKLATLLPMAFGPKDLGFKEGALPVKQTNLARPHGTADELTLAALDAAQRSYAPYTKAPSGVAISARSGRIFKGAYIENVAFNPSLPPFQTALAALIVGGEDASQISNVVLVEVEGAAISQKSVAEAALSAVAPAAKLQVITTKLAV